MAKDPDVQIWKDRIKNGQRFMLKHAGMNSWERYKNYYRHRGFGSAGHIIPVNIMFSILRSMVPQIYFRNPKVSITARKPGLEAELNARIVERIDNWLLRELATKREFKKMITDSFFTGIGTGFFGYDSQFGFSDKFTDPTGQLSLTQFDNRGNRIEFDSTVNPGMPWFLRSRSDDTVFPWGSSDQHSLEWVAFRVFRKVRDLQADKKYTNKQGLKGTHTPVRTAPEGAMTRDINDAREFTSTDDEWIELWQVHDSRTGKIIGLTMEHDKFLRRDTDELQLEGLPVETVVFNQDPDYIYGIPDARIIEPQLLELTDIRTQSQRHRRVNLLKGLIRKDSLDDEALQKLTDANVQALIEVESDTANLSDVYAPINPGVSGILTDLIAQGEVVRGDVRETVGFSRVAQGDFQGKTHVSAAETNQVFRSLNIRLDERRDIMADLLGRVVRKWNQIIFQRWTKERVANIIGPDGAQWWLKFTGPQVRDEYDLNVVAEEGPPMDRETKKQLGLQAAETWAKLNSGQIKQGVPVPPEIQRLVFSQFEDTGLDIDRLLAQTQAQGQQGQQGQGQQLGGLGGSAGRAISPGLLAQLQSGGGGGQ